MMNGGKKVFVAKCSTCHGMFGEGGIRIPFIASMPGTHTPTEMLRAHRAGADLCKLFPAAAGGPVWVRSVLGPMPYLKIVPTNGVDETNAADWLAAGAFGVGFVAPLFPADDLAGGHWDAIEARAARCMAAVRGA